MGTRQENFCIEKGYAHDAEVIYGDTDSAPWADGGYIMATLSYQWGGILIVEYTACIPELDPTLGSLQMSETAHVVSLG